MKSSGGSVKAAACSLLSALLGCASVSAQPCVVSDLGPFTVCVPTHWEVRKAGTDSAAGHLSDGLLSISYDFGLYSSTLRVPAGATDVHESAITVDGHAARRVAYSFQRGGGALVHFLGVHIPEVRASSMGSLKLTLLARASDAKRFDDVEALIPTIRIKPPLSR